jgi:hypothetical protein
MTRGMLLPACRRRFITHEKEKNIMKKTCLHLRTFLALLCAVLLLPALHTPARAVIEGVTEDFLYYSIEGGVATITSYAGEATQVTIPEKVNDGVPVTGIAVGAFYNRRDVTSIKIPNSVTRIEGWAFENCTGLKTITIPPSVTSIGDEVFEGAPNVTIHCSVGSKADTYAKEHSIPYIVRGKTAEGLEYTTDGTKVTITKYTGTANAATIPEKIDGVNVTAIGDGAFKDNTVLKTLTIPASVTSIGEGAFYNTPVTIHCIQNSTAHTYAKEKNILYITNTGEGQTPDGFQYLTDGNSVIITSEYRGEATKLDIPSKLVGLPVNRIADMAFGYNDRLTSVTIPNSVNLIGDGAFYWCTSLKTITIPQSVTSIGAMAFANAPVTIHCITPSTACSYAKENKIPYVARGKTSDGLEYTTDGTNVTIIGYMGKANGITIPEKIDGMNVTAIGEGAFKDNTVLKTITLPAGIKNIGRNAFAGCSQLQTFTFPVRVESIGSYVFENCSSLETITLPSGLKKIGEGMFSRCQKLTAVNIPDSVETIDDYAFAVCSSLKTITIPAKVTSFGEGVFAYTNLTIHGYKGSYAQTYAQEENIPFVALDALPPLPGDANLDGKVNIQDLESLINYLVSKTSCKSMANADANGDETVDIKDVTWIINKIIGG